MNVGGTLPERGSAQLVNNALLRNDLDGQLPNRKETDTCTSLAGGQATGGSPGSQGQDTRASPSAGPRGRRSCGRRIGRHRCACNPGWRLDSNRSIRHRATNTAWRHLRREPGHQQPSTGNRLDATDRNGIPRSQRTNLDRSIDHPAGPSSSHHQRRTRRRARRSRRFHGHLQNDRSRPDPNRATSQAPDSTTRSGGSEHGDPRDARRHHRCASVTRCRSATVHSALAGRGKARAR